MGFYCKEFLSRHLPFTSLNPRRSVEVDDLGYVVMDFLEGIYFVGVHCSLEIVVIIRLLLSLGNVSIARFF